MKKKIFTWILGLSLGLISCFSSAGLASAQESSTCKSEYFEVTTAEEVESIEICANSSFDIGFEDGTIVRIPEPGEQTILTAFKIDGSEVTHSISLTSDYLLKIDSFESSESSGNETVGQNLIVSLIADGGGSAGIIDPGCLYGVFQDSELKWNKRFDWFYDPRGESSIRALSRIQEAIGLWQYPVNRCTGESFSTNFKAKFMGITTTKTSRVSSSGCGGQIDNFNLVSWQALGNNRTLGITCRNMNSTLKYWTETDVVINSSYNDYFFDYPDPLICPNFEYFLVNVAAHEFGHAIGLQHVPFERHQIMSEYTGYCTMEKTGLGPGDYNALMRIYGLDTSNVPI